MTQSSGKHEPEQSGGEEHDAKQRDASRSRSGGEEHDAKRAFAERDGSILHIIKLRKRKEETRT